MGNGEAETFRRKGQARHRRGRFERALFAFFSEHVRHLSGRPGDRSVGRQRHLINPTSLFVGGELSVLALSIGFDQRAIVAASDDALTVAGAAQNAAAVDLHAAFLAFGREQQRFLAQHEHRGLAEEMRGDHGAARIYGADAVGKGG